jgi:hypothetical protein
MTRGYDSVICATLGSLALVSCASGPDKTVASQPAGTVQARIVDTPSSSRYVETDNVVYLPPVPASDNPMPEYPPALLPSRLPPMVISVRLIVNAEGVVTDVQSLDADTSAASAVFLASVREACRRWKFTPMMQGILDSERQADGSIVLVGNATEKPLPFHLDYAFRFTQPDGQPVVNTGASEQPMPGG